MAPRSTVPRSSDEPARRPHCAKWGPHLNKTRLEAPYYIKWCMQTISSPLVFFRNGYKVNYSPGTDHMVCSSSTTPPPPLNLLLPKPMIWDVSSCRTWAPPTYVCRGVGLGEPCTWAGLVSSPSNHDMDCMSRIMFLCLARAKISPSCLQPYVSAS